MVAGFFDPVAGGFFDTRGAADEKLRSEFWGRGGNRFRIRRLLREIRRRRLPCCAAWVHERCFLSREVEQTLEVYAGVAGQHGIFAATYGLAVMRFLQPHTQVVVVGKDEAAAELYRAAVRPLGLNTAVLRLDADKAVGQNLPPALAETIPNLPELRGGRSFAVVCSGFACQTGTVGHGGCGGIQRCRRARKATSRRAREVAHPAPGRPQACVH
jgi:uncharacterized protein